MLKYKNTQNSIVASIDIVKHKLKLDLKNCSKQILDRRNERLLEDETANYCKRKKLLKTSESELRKSRGSTTGDAARRTVYFNLAL